MQVVITKDQLTGAPGGGPCSPFYLDSPEWDEEREALVYENWERTIERLSSSTPRLAHLSWLVSRSLVPMTRMEFLELRRDSREIRSEADAKAKAKKEAVR
ncbi:hypothetical protein LCGC14_3031460 [marine sediment metagenome]|uniref:Uncharacterized protein n=1 Tax=marine sediment metagenome TaxID=412755 RepID=A0A0F8XFG2_9ZZZZ